MCIRQVAGACLIALACTRVAVAQQPAASTPAPGAQDQTAQDQAPTGEQVDVAQESPVYK